MQDGDSVLQAWFGMSRTSLVQSLRCLADDLENLDQDAKVPPHTVAIDSWALAQRTVPCLIGRPIGHPSVADGRPACSSELFYLDPHRRIARTLSRWYRLGTRVDPGYWGKQLPAIYEA